MNILWVSLYPPLPLDFGGPIGIYKRIKSIAQKHDIYLFYMEETLVNGHIAELQTFCKEVHPFCRTKKNIKILLEFLYLPYTAITRHNRQMEKEIIQCVNNKNISLINIEFPQMCINLRHIRSAYSRPIILHQHNVEWLRFQQMAQASSGIKKLLLYWESVKLKRFELNLESDCLIDYYTFLSSKDKDIFHSTFKVSETKTRLIPLGADEYEGETDLAHRGTNIIFCAAMDAQMNVEAALWFAKEILPIISKKIEHVKFFIVGREPQDEVKKLACENIIVSGTVESLDEYYCRADLIVIPLLHGGGVKVKLLEAIGRKKRIVTTSIGIEGTSFLPNIHIPVADEPVKFAELCVDVLLNPECYEEMYRQTFKLFKENFTWNAIGAMYLDMLEGLAKEGSDYDKLQNKD